MMDNPRSSSPERGDLFSGSVVRFFHGSSRAVDRCEPCLDSRSHFGEKGFEPMTWRGRGRLSAHGWELLTRSSGEMRSDTDHCAKSPRLVFSIPEPEIPERARH